MTEIYSKSADFGGQIAAGQFDTEIRNEPAITTTLNYVDVTGDVVSVVFQSAISGPEKTALDALVVAHVPADINITLNTVGYVDITSTLADGAAIKINATDTVGGITLDANNQISLDAGAASNFSTSVGDLTFEAAGVATINGGGGINIGGNNDAQAILIGTSTSVRPITIGNQTGATYVTVNTGTNGFNVNSTGHVSIDGIGVASNISLTTTGDAQDLTISLTGANDSSIIIDSAGTGTDAIRLRTDGSMDFDATGSFNLATGSNSGGAITLDASFNNGGITISAGNLGIAMNSINGTIGIGNWSAATILLGTVGANITTIGNITGTSSVTINSGTGGINIGGNSSTGEIHIGNTAVAKSFYIGNNTSGSRIFTRHGSGGRYKSQPAPTSVSDSNNAISVGALLTGILTGTPTADRTQTLPNASTIVSSISGIAVDDSFDFHFINKSTTDDAEWLIAMGTGGTMEGANNVAPKFDFIITYKTSGTGWFRLRMTNVTASSEAYTVYRLA